MPAPYQRAGLFWCAFLPNAPRRCAVMLTLNQNPTSRAKRWQVEPIE
jgi:hypothetical protein